MKKRIISAIVFVLATILIIGVNNPIADTVIVIIISLIGMYEYSKAFKSAGYNPISWVGYIGCLSIFLIGGVISDTDKIMLIKIAAPTLIIALFVYIILSGLKRSVLDVAITLLSLAYVPFMFSFIKLIFMMENSRVLIWYVFMGAFACDTFAYLVGSKFGKKKLCPGISPNKTVEGSIAGVIGTIIAFVIVTLIANNFFHTNIDMLKIILAAVISAVAGQFGDLSASAIKRHCKIKDFGDIMPGHGGILDRFDSVLFVAPVIYIFLKLYII